MESKVTITQYAQKVQVLAGTFLSESFQKKTISIDDWKFIQTDLLQGIDQLLRQEGTSPDEEGEAILAILMGYTVAIRNNRHIDQTLERAERIFHKITKPILKAKLAVFCYGECFDEELAEMAHQLLKELKPTEEVMQLEALLMSMEESYEIIE